MIRKLPVGASYITRVTFLDQNGRAIQASNPLTFSSDNPSVATVDSNGKVTGISAGAANITVYSVGLNSVTNQVQVYVPVLTSIAA